MKKETLGEEHMRRVHSDETECEDGCDKGIVTKLTYEMMADERYGMVTPRFVPTEGRVGGQLLEYVTCSYDRLVKIFGKPNSDGDKSTNEWAIVDTKTGAILTIYDYKVDGSQYREYDWHIGGMHGYLAKQLKEFILTEV